MNARTRLIAALLILGVVPVRGQDSESSSNAPVMRPVPATPAASPVLPSIASPRSSLDNLQRDLNKLGAKRALAMRSGNLSFWPSADGLAGSLLVIPSGQPQEGQVSQIREDLGVMTKILTDRLRQANVNPEEGPVFWGGQRTIRALYVGNFGAVFIVHVDFPLLPSPEAKQNPAEESTDEVWAKTRQQIFAPDSGEDQDNKRPEFDAAKVAALKDTLTAAIKHTTNIRALAAGESVAIVVMGAGHGESTGAFGAPVELFGRPGGGGEGSVLVLRAGKADIDAFAKGQLDQDGFRKKVTMVTY
jgi:hypothetical protein